MFRGRTFWGIVLVLLGGIFLLDNLGILGNISVWNLVWPLFLIALGVRVLWGTFFKGSVQMEPASLALGGAQRGALRLRHGAGEINVQSGAAAGMLFEGEFGGGLDLKSKREGDTLKARLKLPENAFPFHWPDNDTLNWRVNLPASIPLDLDVESGASKLAMNLQDLRVESLALKCGASSAEVTLPAAAGTTRMTANAGAASLVVIVPAGVAAVVRTRGGLSSVQVDTTRFAESGGMYRSADYETAQNRVDIEVEMGIGSVTIR
ncbi:MAG: DUF5668 domain-containing protein [Chloroflexi bacterium]|nr:DUF5668 domain-containing protein [Chloroflexota bacterium]